MSSKRVRKAPRRFGWEDDDDGGGCFAMDSDSEDPESESDTDDEVSNSESDNESESQSQTQSSQATTSEEESQESLLEDSEWTIDLSAQILPAFTGIPGPKLPANFPDNPDAIDYFSLFLPEEFFVILCTETNRYAASILATDLKAHSRMHEWRDTSPREMQVFMALIMAMGLDDRPTYADYWSTHAIFATSFWSDSGISRNRFEALLRCWHLVNNAEHDPEAQPQDKLWKIRPLLDQLATSFPQHFYPSQHVTIDETMVPWKGRLSFKQYIPIKPNKYGIKVYQVCDSITGYTYGFKVYTGREGKDVDRNHTHNVVTSLMSPLYGRGHILWTDNFYTGIPLAEHLEKNGVRLAGTVRLNRVGMSQVVKNTILDRGSHITRKKGNVMVLKWSDSKVVTFLSTAHAGVMVNSTKKDKDGNPVQVPLVKKEYDRYMNGVDKNDQNVGQYVQRHKSMKWYIKLAFYLIAMVRFQSYLLYAKSAPNPVSQVAYIKELIMSLIESAELAPVQRGRHSAGNLLQRLTARHFPKLIPGTDGDRPKSRRCVVCCVTTGHKRRKGEAAPRRRDSRYVCQPCGDLAMCVTPCFELYHTHKDYQAAYNRLYQEP